MSVRRTGCSWLRVSPVVRDTTVPFESWSTVYHGYSVAFFPSDSSGKQQKKPCKGHVWDLSKKGTGGALLLRYRLSCCQNYSRWHVSRISGKFKHIEDPSWLGNAGDVTTTLSSVTGRIRDTRTGGRKRKGRVQCKRKRGKERRKPQRARVVPFSRATPDWHMRVARRFQSQR